MIYLSAKQEAKDKMKLKSNPKRFMKNKYQIINPILDKKHSAFYRFCDLGMSLNYLYIYIL